ncbi:MAG TPA: class I SAM-dependent methyltransferase [Candidatus Dormibacteraeota bacterium]|jgi:SAM-dependent methyltransferase
MLPRNGSEIDRLDVQHYALREAVRGNHLAPMGAPAAILDVGSGTGQWAFDLGAAFPDASVVGLDLVPGKSDGRPSNYRFVRANILQGLPFPDDTFDFVHQRLMVTALPLTMWPGVVADLLRVTRPGGWVELVEGGDQMHPRGPATSRLLELAAQLAASYGLDTSRSVCDLLDAYLRDAGAEAVERRETALPIGEWGGRVGSLMASDFRSTFQGLCATFESRFGLPAAVCQELLRAMRQECEGSRTRYTFTFAFGRKAG